MTGATGTAGSIPSYGFFTFGTGSVNYNAPVGFGTVSNSGITNSGGLITVPNTGVYLVTYGINMGTIARTGLFTLYVNTGSGFVSQGYNFNVGQLRNPPGLYNWITQSSQTVILSLPANAQIELRNETTGVYSVQLSQIGYPQVGAYLDIIQLQ